jgi:integrase
MKGRGNRMATNPKLNAAVNPARTSPAYDGYGLLRQLRSAITTLRFRAEDKRRLNRSCEELVGVLDRCPGRTPQDRWLHFEKNIWPGWLANEDRLSPEHRWTWGVRVLVMARLVVPSWEWTCHVHLVKWIARLPETDPLFQQYELLRNAVNELSWAAEISRIKAIRTGLRVLLTRGYSSLKEITDADLSNIPVDARGVDTLDRALCALGVFTRTPKRGTTRKSRLERLCPDQMLKIAQVPERFRAVTTLYLETYSTRISDTYSNLRHKAIALAHFWRFVYDCYPEVRTCADVLPAHARAYIPHALERARRTQRGESQDDVRITAHAWLLHVRTFFADICAWATESDSPFRRHAPLVVPLQRNDLRGIGFEKARRQQLSRMTARIIDLEREMPKLRAFAFRQWQEARDAYNGSASDAKAGKAEVDAFWNWALLELLVQSGLRIEEASELTTLDILKRSMPDRRIYYMLHVKPSKYDRARVVPIGDGLGRVLAEIIRHVRAFYGTDSVPACDHWDHKERRPRPRAPYLLQGSNHPSPIGIQTIRGRIQALSIKSGLKRADGSPLVVVPHDCRRVFASEHLNNDTPVHVIQALLGHATIDTVMVYAKLYPQKMIEEYRKAMRGVYNAFHGEESFKNPTRQEWDAFAASCSMRDMGTHLCALPTGEHCPRGLVCLGCNHAQPKKSAVPIFRRMLASHERELHAARDRNEPAGQIASRELEIVRIGTALRRANELDGDVAAAVEAAASALGGLATESAQPLRLTS